MEYPGCVSNKKKKLLALREHMCSDPLLFGYPSRAHVFRAALVWLPFASTCSEPLLFGEICIPMFNHTRGEHANYYTSDAVGLFFIRTFTMNTIDVELIQKWTI
jgi:hypothetical protein